MRRYFFNALETAPEQAQDAVARTLIVYQVEHKAQPQGIVGTGAHRVLRNAQARPIFDQWHAWLLDQKDRFPPRGP